MGVSLLKHINVFITAATLVNNLVSIDFDIFNPFDTELHILFIQSDGKLDGTTFSHFEEHFDNFVVPPGQTVNSGRIQNVLLVQGALASLPIIPRAMLDVFNAVTAQIGENGYIVPWLQVSQLSVPVTYTLDLFGLANIGLPQLKSAALSMSSASVAATAKTSVSSSVAASASVSIIQNSPTASVSTGSEAAQKPSESAQAQPAPSSEAKETPQATAQPETISPAAKVEPTPSPTPTEMVFIFSLSA